MNTSLSNSFPALLDILHVLVHELTALLNYRHRTRADELVEAVGQERSVKLVYLLLVTGLLDYHVVIMYVKYAHVVPAYHLLHIAATLYLLERYLLQHYILWGVAEGLQHVNLLLVVAHHYCVFPEMAIFSNLFYCSCLLRCIKKAPLVSEKGPYNIYNSIHTPSFRHPNLSTSCRLMILYKPAYINVLLLHLRK